MRRTVILAIALSLAITPALVVAEEGDADDATGVNAAASVDDGVLAVSGDVAFGPAVADDHTAVEGSGGPLGTDIVGARVTSDPDDPDVVEFAMEVAGLPPVLGGVPDVVIYGWDLRVDGSAVGEGDTANLEWRRTNITGAAATANPDAADEFIVVRSCVPNPDTGGNTCGAGEQLDGAFDADAGELRALVPVGQGGLEAEPGSVVNGGVELSVYHGTGVIWLTLATDTAFLLDDLTIGDRADSVRIAVVPAGEDVDEFDVTVTPDGEGANGSFDTEIDTADLDAGDYDVVVEACWGDNCGTDRTPVTLP